MNLRFLPAAFLVAALSALDLSAADPADAKALRGVLPGSAQGSFGSQGLRVFRSEAEWNAFRGRLGELGWKKPDDDPTAKTDFSRDMIACVFQHGEVDNAFVVRKCAGDGKQGELEIGMSWVKVVAGRVAAPDWKFICVAMPKAPRLKVSVLTFHPKDDGPNPTLEKACPEWVLDLDDTAGDNVDGLQGSIKAENATVKPGEDILVNFTLQFDCPCVVKDGHFASITTSASVWDGKYSNGYRNHAFFVTTPDGKSHFLRPAVIKEWDKNMPHLVKIEKDEPYTLPEWREGETAKSLKALGLDTTAKGIYRITGFYAEGMPSKREETLNSWHGELSSNTIEVEVK